VAATVAFPISSSLSQTRSAASSSAARWVISSVQISPRNDRGCLLIGVINNLLTLAQVPSFYVQASTGPVIIIAAVLTTVASRRSSGVRHEPKRLSSRLPPDRLPRAMLSADQRVAVPKVDRRGLGRRHSGPLAQDGDTLRRRKRRGVHVHVGSAFAKRAQALGGATPVAPKRSRLPIRRPATPLRPIPSPPMPTPTTPHRSHACGVMDVDPMTAIRQAEVRAAKTMLDRTTERNFGGFRTRGNQDLYVLKRGEASPTGHRGVLGLHGRAVGAHSMSQGLWAVCLKLRRLHKTSAQLSWSKAFAHVTREAPVSKAR
jgi:hypothetical protein